MSPSASEEMSVFASRRKGALMIVSPHLPWQGTIAGFKQFSVMEYHKLIQMGLLTEDDNLELLERYLAHKMTRNPPHD